MGFDIETIFENGAPEPNPFMQSCPLLVNAQLIFTEVLERDWCGELAEIEQRRENFSKIAPVIYDLLFND